MSWKSENIPCHIKIVNHGVRQAHISKFEVCVTARNSWSVVVDFKCRQKEYVTLKDGEEYKDTFYLINEIHTLRKMYKDSSSLMDRLFLKRIHVAVATNKDQSILLKVDKVLTKIIIDEVFK